MSIKYPTFPSRIKIYEVSSSYVTGSNALFNNLTVSGSSSVINSTNVYFKDNLIEINVGNTSNQGAGLYISGSNGDVSMRVVEDGAGLGINTYVSAADGFVGDGSQLTNLKIGNPEDGQYNDGLFIDLTSNTNIGVAIDRFNEVLKGLAPKVAPNLSNLERNIGAAISMNLAFGNSNNVAGYTNVTASLDGPLMPISFDETFTSINGSGAGAVRMGVFSTPIQFNLILNNQVQSDYDNYVNYPDNSFNVATDGYGSYSLEINGQKLIPSASTNNDLAIIQNNFSLSSANAGKFVSSGETFNLFKYRTGFVTIPTSTWRLGHNYAKVVYSSSLGINTTNYVDWIYDSASINGGGADYNFVNYSLQNKIATGTKYLSGIKYYTQYNYNFVTEINNFYKNTYKANGDRGITFINLSDGLIASPVSIPSPINDTSIVYISSPHTVSSVRILSSSINSTLNIDNSLGKTATLTLSTDKLLIDGINLANTINEENFCFEDYRAINGNYDTESDALNAIGSFPSSSFLSSNDLIVYSGSLMYPNKIINNGNVAGSGIQVMYNTQPDYSNFTGLKNYYRIFTNGGSARATLKITFTRTNSNFVNNDQILTGNNIKAWIKVPGLTGWRDITLNAPNETISVQYDDNVGAMTGTPLIVGNTITYFISLSSQVMNAYKNFVLKIQSNDSWNGYLSKIQIGDFSP